MDRYGHPTDEELKVVEEWSDYKNYPELMQYIKEIWMYANSGYWVQEGNVYYISTGGWSGNESIIHAMKNNLMFWSTCWEEHRRGGHYKFELP